MRLIRRRNKRKHTPMGGLLALQMWWFTPKPRLELERMAELNPGGAERNQPRSGRLPLRRMAIYIVQGTTLIA
jgi:hypothetical protein